MLRESCWRTWLRWTGLSGRRDGAARVRRRQPVRLELQSLEDRTVPSLINVSVTTDGIGPGTLRGAFIKANGETGTSTIKIASGIYRLTTPNQGDKQENFSQTGDLDINPTTNHRYVIQGQGISGTTATIIDASNLDDRVLQILTTSSVTLKNLVITGGFAVDDGTAGASAGSTISLGGGILIGQGGVATSLNSLVSLQNVVLLNNVARGADGAAGTAASATGGAGQDADGGGLYTAGGTLNLTLTTRIINNRAQGGRGGDAFTPSNGSGGAGGTARGAGLFINNSSVTARAALIDSNQAVGGAGGTGNGLGNGGNAGDGLGGGAFLTGPTGTSLKVNLATSNMHYNLALGGHGGDSGAIAGGNAGNGGSALGGGVFVNNVTVKPPISKSRVVLNYSIAGLKGTRGANGMDGASQAFQVCHFVPGTGCVPPNG